MEIEIQLDGITLKAKSIFNAQDKDTQKIKVNKQSHKSILYY